MTFSLPSTIIPSVPRQISVGSFETAVSIVTLFQEISDKRKRHSSFILTFGIVKQPHHAEIGAEHARQPVRTVLAIHTLRDAHDRVSQMFRHISVDYRCSMVDIFAGSDL